MADYYGDRTIPNRVKPGGKLGSTEYFYTTNKKTGLITINKVVTSGNAQDDVIIGTINPNGASITANANASADEIAHWRTPSNVANTKSTAASISQKEWNSEPVGTRNPQSPKSQILKTPVTTKENISTTADKSLTEKTQSRAGTKTAGFNSPGGGPWRYPLTIGESQRDYLMIRMLEYKAKGLGQESLAGGKFGIGNDRDKTRKGVGSVVLPIPAGISATNMVGWQEGTMDALTAGVGGMVMDTLAGGEAGGTEAGVMANAADAIKANLPEVKKALAGTLAQQIMNNQSLMARATGQILNPNMELLFSSPNLRDFSFDFKLSPRSKAEADAVLGIIRFFRRGMAPIRTKANLFLKSPNTFSLQYMRPGRREHNALNKFKECALTNASVQFTPDGNYSTFPDGVMTSYQMTLSFRELSPVFNDDYAKEGGIGY